MPTQMHVGFDTGYVRQVIEMGGNQGFIEAIEADGVRSLPREDALAYLDELERQGITILSSCPTPQPNGGCPGHKRKVQRREGPGP